MADRRQIEGMYRGFGMPLLESDASKHNLYKSYEQYRPIQEGISNIIVGRYIYLSIVYIAAEDEPENIASESPTNTRSNTGTYLITLPQSHH